MNAIEKVIEDNMGLVYMQLHRFQLAYNEDAISYAMEALFKAAKSFEEGKGLQFSTYAMACIYNGIQMYFRDIGKKRIECVPMEDFTNEHGDVFVPSRSFKVCSAEDECTHQSTCSIYDAVYRVYDNFKGSEKARKAVLLWIESDFTLTTIELAERADYSQPSVSRALNAFRIKLKEELDKC